MDKVCILSKKMIKPRIPTPQTLKIYKISFTDQLAPRMNVPLILFYSSSPSDYNPLITKNINHLQQSLANILPKFYPLAGRYVSKDNIVHCNDEGIEFVEARACSEDFSNVSEYVKSGKHEQLNNFLLPRLSCEVDDVTDPVVSVQVTVFGCGGLAIGLSFSHRVFDADSISTFVQAWAREATLKEEGESKMDINPSFESPTMLPFKNMFAIADDAQLPRTIDSNIISRRFLFDENAISALKGKIKDKSRRVSRVNAVCALITVALLRADRLRHGRSRNFLISQAVNIRDRTVPPFPKYSCGNLSAQAILKLRRSSRSNEDDVGFEDLSLLLRGAIDKTIGDCAGVFRVCDGDEGHKVLYGPVMDLVESITSSDGEESNAIFFTDWSKFKFYEADFGWGEPVWTSSATRRVENVIVLMENREGDGIEAWVNLFKEDMVVFEQDEDITMFDNFKS